jgi:hypothetical protein
LFRPNADVPVLRGTAVTMSKREGYLWTTGYIPRLRTYPGFETPKPLADCPEATHVGRRTLEARARQSMGGYPSHRVTRR